MWMLCEREREGERERERFGKKKECGEILIGREGGTERQRKIWEEEYEMER